MKQAWVAGGILIVMLVASWGNAQFIRFFADSLSETLTQAEAAAELGDWASTGALTRNAHERWDRTSSYLCAVLRHSDTDEVDVNFHEVLEFIECQEGSEYSSANAVLMEQIDLLAEKEKLNLKNLL